MDDKDRQFIEALFLKQGEQFKQHVTAVAESFDHKISLLAEGHHVLLNKMEGLEERFDRLEEKFDRLDLRFDKLADLRSKFKVQSKSEP